MTNNQELPKMKIDINDLLLHICPKCSNTAFSDAMEIRILSPLLSSSGNLETVKVPIAVCSMCGQKVLIRDLEKEKKDVILQ